MRCRLLREYMELEFTSQQLGFPFDIEKFIDDFVLFCMLIGNDFLPSELLSFTPQKVTGLLALGVG